MSGITRWELEGDGDASSARRLELGSRIRMLIQVGSAEVGGLIEIVECKDCSDLAWSSVTGIDQRGRWRLRDAGDGRRPGSSCATPTASPAPGSPGCSPSASPRRSSPPPARRACSGSSAGSRQRSAGADAPQARADSAEPSRRPRAGRGRPMPERTRSSLVSPPSPRSYSTSSRFSTLPVGLRGSSSRNSTSRGTL